MLFLAVAALSSMLGMVVGKYVYYLYYLKESGMDVAANVRFFSFGVLKSFIMNGGFFPNGFGELLMGLGVVMFACIISSGKKGKRGGGWRLGLGLRP